MLVMLIMLICSFFVNIYLILSSIAIISFYILSKRFFLKREGLSGVRVASKTKKDYGFALHFCEDS